MAHNSLTRSQRESSTFTLLLSHPHGTAVCSVCLREAASSALAQRTVQQQVLLIQAHRNTHKYVCMCCSPV